VVTRRYVADWLAGYERAWRAPGTALVRQLFAQDARYSPGPYDEPSVGIDPIAVLWEAEREGPDEVFTMESDIVAVDGDTAVVRVEVRYGDPVVREYRDLWVIRFAEDGTCADFEEWPFWPGQPLAAGAP
jgi:SnoaL-like domain